MNKNNKPINPNLRRLVDQTYDPSVKVDEEVLKEQEEEFEEERFLNEKPRFSLETLDRTVICCKIR